MNQHQDSGGVVYTVESEPCINENERVAKPDIIFFYKIIKYNKIQYKFIILINLNLDIQDICRLLISKNTSVVLCGKRYLSRI